MSNAILAEIQSTPWVMEPLALQAMTQKLAEPQAAAGKVESGSPGMTIKDGVAVIEISGALMRTVPSYLKYYGIEATGYMDLQSQIIKAAGDSTVKEIILDVNSPGGEVGGCMETAAVIYQVRGKKPIKAYVSGAANSGAYWLISQTTEILSTANGCIGSIGAYMVAVDMSQMAKDAGVKVHVVSSGDLKGGGVPGTKIQAKHIAAWQSLIDGMADNFITDVARGRGMNRSNAKALATGQVWLAAEARRSGLIDFVVTVASAGELAGVKCQDQQQDFMKEVEKRMKNEGVSKSKAIAAVVNDRPELHREYLRNYNKRA